MAPPERHRDEGTRRDADDAPAVLFAARTPETSLPLETLTRRADFLAAARARRQATPGFVLQARRRDSDGPVRVGFTCSKKVGNAVARNRAKRRLREIARAVLPTRGRPGWDYVLIGRHEVTATRDFRALQADLEAALERVHGAGTAP